MKRKRLRASTGKPKCYRCEKTVTRSGDCACTDNVCLIHGDSSKILPYFDNGVFDSIVSDPPYPEVPREYGKLSVLDWFNLTNTVIYNCKRTLTERGSLVFILQPNSEKCGKMRPWIWDFMSKWSNDWNVVQDIYWFNTAPSPTIHISRKFGLLKPSIKYCVWLGSPNCFRQQDAILMDMSFVSLKKASDFSQAKMMSPSGLYCKSRASFYQRGIQSGGTCPPNVIVVANSNSRDIPSTYGHPARTPNFLANWLIRYITPKGGITVDPFCGSGTMLFEARKLGVRALGIEAIKEYCDICSEKLESIK